VAKTVLYTGSAATFRTVGAAATTQNLFTIENTAGSAVLVGVRSLVMQLDATAVLTAVMPLVKTTRIAIPTGGTTLAKVALDTSQSSVANVIVRGATASDGGGATAITATPGGIIWQQYGMRVHTAVGQIASPDYPLLPSLVSGSPLVLRPSEALLVQVVAAAGTSNPATNHWFVQCVWEEFTVT